ncbi:MAG: hypothetical protein GZ094_02555 [Mariniphaga sp.]|nr:hypothetical protein [Mariniphaga sp.]
MFFFGAFSGNLLYLILAISYLAGFSALAFRSPDNQTKDIKLSDVSKHQILCTNNFHEHSVLYITNITNLEDQALSEEISLQPPVITHSKFLLIPPPLAPRSHFSGSALFSRPPPYSLV